MKKKGKGSEPSFLPIKHLSYDKKEKKFKQRRFRCDLFKESKKAPYYKLVFPKRQFIVQLIKFAPGKGPKDHVEFYDELDKTFVAKYGKTRHELDIHEIVSFITWGAYDMVVLWDAPNLAAFNELLAETLNPGNYADPESLIVASCIQH